MQTRNEKIKKIAWKILPEKTYLKLLYKYCHKEKLSLKDPKRLSEKIFWLKLYNEKYSKKLVQIIYDKLKARTYIKEKIGNLYENYLPTLYGVYDDADDIDFDKLPKQYVLKVTQGCAENIINNGKKKVDIKEVRGNLNVWLKENTDINFIKKKWREEAYYFDGNAKIMCEEYLGTEEGEKPLELEIFCFNGEAKLYGTLHGNETGHDLNITRNMYDIDHNFVDVKMGRENDESLGDIYYENFHSAIEMANLLAKDLIYVRIDFYIMKERVVVGELTMIPQGGLGPIKPIEMDYELGECLELPTVEI